MIPSDALQVIEERIKRELSRSINKHGMWDDKSYEYMLAVINAEMDEVESAIDIGDHHGEHGTFNEACQVAACCIKLCHQILLREPAASGEE